MAQRARGRRRAAGGPPRVQCRKALDWQPLLLHYSLHLCSYPAPMQGGSFCCGLKVEVDGDAVPPQAPPAEDATSAALGLRLWVSGQGCGS